MKLPSILNPTHALRGMRTLALAALTGSLLAASTASAALVQYRFHYSGVPLGNTAEADGVMTLDDTLIANPGDSSAAIVAVTMTVTGSAANNGTFTEANFGFYYLSFVDAINLNIEWVGQAQPSTASTWGLAGTSGEAGDLNFFSNGSDANAPTGQFYFELTTPGGESMTLTSVTPAVHSVLFTKGDNVPGVAGKTFTAFGVPAVNASGTVAFLGKWSGGAGIFANGVLVAQVGDVISGTSALKSMKDPVIDDAGYVAFPCALIGAGISATNDAAIVSNAPGGTLAIVAQEGTQAADAPVGALYKSFTSTAAPGGGGGVIILGFMAQGAGGITSTTDNAVWSADAMGVLHLMLQEGTTVIGTKTVKNFAVLKAVSGTPGQTHAHNTNGELVSKVTFTDGFQTIVKTFLP